MSTAADIRTEASAGAPAGTYDIDPVHSKIGFEVKHLGVSTFRGNFGGFEGTVTVGESGLERIDGKIEVGSIEVPEKQLIGHLLSDDFFAAEQYPTGEFHSTEIVHQGEDRYKVVGDFTLRGVTRPVELELTVEGVGQSMTGGDLMALAAVGSLDRTEYGISWSNNLDNGVAVVSERVRLVLQVEAVKA